MTAPALSTNSAAPSLQKSTIDPKDDSSLAKIERTYSEELVIGICAPIGSLKEEVIEKIKSILSYSYDYDCEVIKLSDFIKKYGEPFMTSGSSDRAAEMRHLIEQGDKLRSQYKSPAFLAELAIFDIFRKRADNPNKEELSNILELNKIPELFDRNGDYDKVFRSKRKCYIIDSLKNKDEVNLFRSIYRELFYFISVSTPIRGRIKNLHQKSLSEAEAESIINTDSDEADNKFGQKVRDTFVLGDFFINVTRKNSERIFDKITRFLHLVFDTKVVTPTIHETAMYHAKSAGTNSACLSRQVGAAVTDSQGKVLAIGWNDVPKFGGSLYQDSADAENADADARCMFRNYSADKSLITGSGMCFNDYEKSIISEDLTSLLIKEGLIAESNREQAQKTLRGSKIKDLIEYSRAVHAEMHAIIIASQTSGASMKDARLYCTTYPCHNCGRHIIAAGIESVYYIEPYVKSLSTRLHSDAITEDEEDKSKVRILMFEGVAPNRYLKFFSIHGKRKAGDGKATTMGTDELKRAKPKTQLTLRALPLLEVQALHSLFSNGFTLDEVMFVR